MIILMLGNQIAIICNSKIELFQFDNFFLRIDNAGSLVWK